MSTLKVLQVERKFGKTLAEIMTDLSEAGLTDDEIARQTTFSTPLVVRLLEALSLKRTRAVEQVTFRGKTGSVFSHIKAYGLGHSRVYRAIKRGATPVEALEMAVGGGE